MPERWDVKNKCGNCQWYDPEENLPDWGYCRNKAHGVTDDGHLLFGRTFSGRWCGDYRKIWRD